MKEHERGQVAANAAMVYEEFFVPALFAQWTDRVLDAADVQEGDNVLDVACGTGVLARAAARRVGAGGSVVGIDVNEGMIAVARDRSPHITWKVGRAESLPFAPETFDCVVSQFGLMFFEDRSKAIAEMGRVIKPGGHVAVAVWDSLDATPGYAAVAEMLDDLFGPEVARSIHAPFALGDTEKLRNLFADAGMHVVAVQTLPGRAQFASIESWIYTDIKGWTLADRMSEEEYQQLQHHAQRRLSRFVGADGSVAFEAPAHIVTAAPAA